MFGLLNSAARYVEEYPATAHTIIGAGLFATAVLAQAALRAARQRTDVSEGVPSDAEAGAGRGSFLDGLPERPPGMDLSACESFMSFAGCTVSVRQEMDLRFAELRAACADLPAKVEGRPALQRSIDGLRKQVAALAASHFTVVQRGDALGAVELLCLRAEKLTKRWRSSDGVAQMAPMLRPAPDSSSVHAANPSSDFLEKTPSGEPANRKVSRRNAVAIEQPYEPARQRPAAQARELELNQAETRILDDALAIAWKQRDGKGRLTVVQERQLQQAVAGLFGGRSATHIGYHGARSSRLNTVVEAVKNATHFLRPHQRDAVLAFVDGWMAVEKKRN